MSNLAEARKDLELEDVSYRAAVSESVASKLGSSINFINRKQYDKHAFVLNGFYSLGVGSTGTDGKFTFLFDAEIVGFSYSIGSIGTGTTQVDVRLLNSNGTNTGSIFSTLPAISSSASADSATTYDQLNSSTVANPTGHTLAVASTVNVSAGQSLRLDLITAQIGSNNFQLTIFYRPR